LLQLASELQLPLELIDPLRSFARRLFQRAVLHFQHRNPFTEQWHKMLRKRWGDRQDFNLSYFVMKLRIGEGPRTAPWVGFDPAGFAVSVNSHGFTGVGAMRATHRLGAVRDPSLSGQ
jgi:hypothetical protein